MSEVGYAQVSISRSTLLNLLELKPGIVLENISVGPAGELNLLCSGPGLHQMDNPNSKVQEYLSSVVSDSKYLQRK